ncbi:retinoblastoma-like protein 2 [Latimeria chalumnae]|uniref:Retinoblastoma-like protein 2 n=1 Tax=Latimeria chalumnae TaxID=7897 RepID=H3A0E3_LATCH|nr:PREDICTED: retinoblastoma-like protein 2 [Latimeria chalumnae]XP_006003017.1 PREDICTED: retinoblastoma-like protein 2 [Latimeria chalumnae]|eukprot:XP_006003016.1 PREDICTED: retinoblastoma-like protein 2 [Latimeria chalumnae]
MTHEEEEGEGAQRSKQRFEELCRNLNMDEAARCDAWDSFERISRNYTLEGNDLHWLACALYVACRKAVPTVSRGTVEGNYVSLTRILRCSEQSLIEFFNKMKKWEDMANLPQEFRDRTEKLERNFTVSAVIFKKYEPIFQDLFRDPLEEQPRQQRGRKQRRQPCTVHEVFYFCWVLFVLAKGNFPMISDDLVNSYHLLLCALDLVYGNALFCPNRKELLNPAFKGLPEDFDSKDYKVPCEAPCIIETLCSLHDGLVLEAKGIKEHFWKPYIRKLFDKKLLKGKEENLLGFLDPGHFGDSLKAVNKAYDEYVLSVGNLDERIFLGEDADEEIGTLNRCFSHMSGIETAERVQMKHSLQQHFDKSKAFRVSTPLTGRKYIKENRACGTPVSSATQSVSRLHTLLMGLKNGPSEKLLQLFRACSRNPFHSISARLKEMYDVFCHCSTQSDGEYTGSCKDIATKHFRLAEVLYYKVLEAVIEQEKKRLGDTDLSGILEQDVLHRSLLACCLEIVIFSYKPPGYFPWVIEIFDLPPYHFYKVIEVLIRAEEGLFREVVKHLNHVEEQILESLAWKQESPVWDAIKDAENKVPTCEEVMPAQFFENPNGSSANPTLTPSRINEIHTETGGIGRIVAASPTTLHDRYSSPSAGSARRRLFIEADSASDSGSSARLSQQHVVNTVPVHGLASETMSLTPVPGQTLVTMATATVTANNGQTVTIPVQGIANENGGITFIPVQVSVTGQHQSVAGTIQTLTAQSLSAALNPQQVTGTAVQVAGQVAIQQVSSSPGQQQRRNPQALARSKPKKSNSLSLFFRKVYHLASVRLRDLCSKLDISDDLRQKIWTCFEFSLVHCPDLMMDRNIDQLLMCAIYVMAKVTKEDKSFQNIMRCYRTQPQASSSVYRNVLLRGRKRRISGSSDSSGQQSSLQESNRERNSRDSSPVMRSNSTLPVPHPNSAPPTPTRLMGANSDLEEEERGDLIQFYNNIYVEQIQEFAQKYSPASGGEAPPLSPFPSLRAGSPRRVQLSQHHSIYISPHRNGSTLSPREKILYYFSSSPSKKLREINSMIKTGDTPSKKRSILLEENSDSPAKRICPENHTALMRRLQDVANDRGTL